MSSVKLSRRKTATLVRWWHLFNRWEWPKEFGEPESRKATPYPRRTEHMQAIQMELGWRVIRNHGKEQPNEQ